MYVCKIFWNSQYSDLWIGSYISMCFRIYLGEIKVENAWFIMHVKNKLCEDFGSFKDYCMWGYDGV